MARVGFRKYEGLGNDFVVMNWPIASLPEDRAMQLCDRHFGIGADGVLLIGPPSTRGAAARMTVWNADGSRPEMCGNGLRCVALEVRKQRGNADGELVIDTDAGPLACKFVDGQVEVAMGRLVDRGALDIDLDHRSHRFRHMTIGNPHAITFERYEPREIDDVGLRVATHPTFPQGTNVEFAGLAADGAIDLVVWERGVGRTLACGTGACATVGAACVAGFRRFEEWTDVRLPGGKLSVLVEKGSMATRMRGPARLVFEGEVDLS